MPFSFKNEHPIFKIAFEGDLTALQAFIKQDPKLASLRTSNDGWSLLHLAVEIGHIPMIKWLLSPDGKAQITERNSNGSTALFVAASFAGPDTLEWLLENTESDITEINNRGATALLSAAAFGQTNSVKWLLENTESDIKERDRHGVTSLLAAIANGRISTVEWLLENTESDISECNKYGETPLLMAAAHGQTETVEWLLENTKSQLAETSQYAFTPLIAAAYFGHTNTVTYLLNHPNMSFKHLRTSLAAFTLTLKDESQQLIDKKIADYEALIEKASSDEGIQSYIVETDKVIVADALFCPITWRLIKDPVIAADGCLYERASITEWLQQSDKSPKTNKKLSSTLLFPATDTKRILNDIVDAVDVLYKKTHSQKQITAPKVSLFSSIVSFFGSLTEPAATSAPSAPSTTP